MAPYQEILCAKVENISLGTAARVLWENTVMAVPAEMSIIERKPTLNKYLV